MLSYYIIFWVLLFCQGRVNECSLSLHNQVALFQLSAVLFWCVSLFPTAHPSNQLWSISDFLSSVINSGWACGPEESWANEDIQRYRLTNRGPHSSLSCIVWHLHWPQSAFIFWSFSFFSPVQSSSLRSSSSNVPSGLSLCGQNYYL